MQDDLLQDVVGLQVYHSKARFGPLVTMNNGTMLAYMAVET